jgi:hypothetical protein
VVLSKKDSRRVRVLAVKDLFDVIELCLVDEKGEQTLPFFGATADGRFINGIDRL